MPHSGQQQSDHNPVVLFFESIDLSELGVGHTAISQITGEPSDIESALLECTRCVIAAGKKDIFYRWDGEDASENGGFLLPLSGELHIVRGNDNINAISFTPSMPGPTFLTVALEKEDN